MSLSINMTEEDTARFAKYMAERFDARIVEKEDDEAMNMIAKFLGLCGIMDADHFLKDYATTIPDPAGKEVALIALPWSRGPFVMARTIVHECQHASQIYKDGPVAFAIRYLASKDDRSLRYEAPAYGSNLEIDHAVGGHLDPDGLARNLYAYALGDGHVAAVTADLRSRCVTIERGGIITEAANAALLWET